MFITNPFRFNLSDLFRSKSDATAEMLRLKGLIEEGKEPAPEPRRKKRKRKR